MASSNDYHESEDSGTDFPPLAGGQPSPPELEASEEDEFNEEDFDDDFDEDFEDELDEDLKEFEAELDGNILGENSSLGNVDDEFEEDD